MKPLASVDEDRHRRVGQAVIRGVEKHRQVDLTDGAGQTQYHSVDDASVFIVYPADDSRGLVRLEGRWTPAAELERT